MATCNDSIYLWCFIMLMCTLGLVQGQDTGACRSRACYPLSEDLLQNLPNRTIRASSICGNPAEVYELRFAGLFSDTYQTTQCNATDPTLSHDVENLFDVTTQNLFGNIYTRPILDTWWQSVTGEQIVNLGVTFGDTFLFQGTVMLFRSVRSLSATFEKSNNFGRTWEPLRYYAQSCATSFPGVPRTSNSYDLPFCEEKFYYGDSTTEDAGDIQKVIDQVSKD